MPLLFLSALALLSSSGEAVEQPVGREALWRAIHAYSEQVDAGFQIPSYPQYSTWRVSGKMANEVIYQEKVPVFDLNSLTGDVMEVGSIKVGTDIALDFFKSHKSRYYYEVPGEKVEFTPGLNKPTAWVNGTYIERDPSRSFVPPKDYILSPAYKKYKESKAKK